ncbi:twin-arginine translocation signal domain-containing protein, partial [bacterium]|nr:twin-arginine translocation signal domain-containing protein [bacterium]
MKTNKPVTRRGFLKKASIAAGAGVIGTPVPASVYAESKKYAEVEKRLPREVWIGSVDIRVKYE